MARSARSASSTSPRSGATGNLATSRWTKRLPTIGRCARRCGGLYRKALAGYFGGKDGPRGCFAIGTATTEAVRDPKIRALLAEGFQMIDDAFAARIRFARDHGDLPKGADPAVLAMLASATLHTLAIRSRSGASRSTLEAMADATVHLICGPPPGDDHDRNN